MPRAQQIAEHILDEKKNRFLNTPKPTFATFAKLPNLRPKAMSWTSQGVLGETECYIDGTCVHIREEDGEARWREMRVGAYAKRERSDSAIPKEWGTRDLEPPTVVSAFAAIESAKDFQERCQDERRRLGWAASLRR